MKTCSRLDLFQTGATSTPCPASMTNAGSCAFACRPKRSPTPNENRSRLNTRPFWLMPLRLAIFGVGDGANTYIGNDPKFMVKNIADHQKAHRPGFPADVSG